MKMSIWKPVLQMKKQNFRYALLWTCVVIVMLCVISLMTPRRTTDFIQSTGAKPDFQTMGVKQNFSTENSGQQVEERERIEGSLEKKPRNFQRESGTVSLDGKEAEKSRLSTSSYKPFCDYSSDRSDVCDMKGDVRIHGASSSIFFIRYHQNADQVGDDEIVRIRPYARKFDPNLLERIGEIKITSTGDSARAFTCAENQSIPAIIFANGGLLGNFYHDFSDALIPLFITSRQFNGEVQFLITNMQAWWVGKYKPILSKLSNYELIDLTNEDHVRCYPRVIVNLHSHKKVSIDPSRTPGNYSMVDFARFLRKVYSLDREFVDISQRKPKLLIITRSRTRKFTNTEAIISMAEQLGYEVLAQEADSNLAEFSKIVNSCDVMMGVHGAGLTHFMFLPDNAVHIQVAPLGKPSSREDLGLPAIDRNLRYIQYNISEEESTLSEKYPRDHPVFTDPDSIFRQGYTVSSRIYLVEQNVKLDISRFRPVLVRALELLRRQ